LNDVASVTDVKTQRSSGNAADLFMFYAQTLFDEKSGDSLVIFEADVKFGLLIHYLCPTGDYSFYMFGFGSGILKGR
jgi:hypothetical protein